jgi:phospholipid/cholesterol/gamma-HCH transport system permease protein
MCDAHPPHYVNGLVHWLEEIGRGTIDFYKQVLNLCAFFGEIMVVVVEAILQPKRFRPNAVLQQMYEVWIRALVNVGVLCFLIGVVIA